MKKIRKVLIAVFSVMLLVCMGLFAAACDNGNSNSNDNGNTSGNEQTETTYTVTYALGDHAAAGATVPASATANKANSYKVTLPAAPKAASGWKFNGWKVGNDTELKAAGAELTVSANVTVTAQWTEDVAPAATYTVTYALGDHAAADAQVPAAATANEANGYKVTLPAAPDAAEGWKFNGWKVGNDVKAAGSEITVSANMTVTADWAEVVYTVTYALGDHAAADAQVPPAATANLANSYKVTLPAAPKAADEWKFTGWKVGDDTELKAAGAELTVSANVTVTAQWAEVTPPAEEYVNLTLTCGDNGTATLDPAPVDGKVAKGTSVKLTVTPAANYDVDSVKVNNAPVELTGGEYTFTADADITVEVSFKAQLVSVTLNYDAKGGSVTCDPALADGKVAKGTSVKLTVTPAQYYDVESVKVNNAEVQPADGVYTFTADADTTVEVTFKVQMASVKVTCGENGTAALDPAPDTDGKIAKGTSAKLTLTPASDPDKYIIEKVILKSGAEDEGTDVTADLVGNEYTFVVTGDVELVVTFKKFEAVTSMDSTYNGSWQCRITGDTTSTTNIAVVTRTNTIRITGDGVTATISGTAYTATLGYTVYIEGSEIEERYTIYLVPGLSNAILALTIGTSTTYFIKTSPSPSLPTVTIDEAFMNADGSEGSSWYGGAASMPISFEFGKLKIDGVEARFIAESKTDSGLVYTVYANGGLYDLIYTKADDSMVLHPYGKSTENDIPYERETPPDPVLVPQFAGFYSNNEHNVNIDAEGNFSFDGTARKLYYDNQTKVYTFRTNVREYTVKFVGASIEVFNAAANEDWVLKKIEEGTAQYTLTVNCPSGTYTYSPKNAEMKYYAGSSVTLSITPNKHFEVEQVTVNGEDKTFTNDAGVIKVTVTVDADTTVEVIFKEFKEENLLSDLYQGVYTYGTTTVTITATDVTVKDTKWSLTVKFTDAQITNTGEGQFTLVNGNRKFTFTFSNENKTLKVGDPNWAMGGSAKTLTKQEP